MPCSVQFLALQARNLVHVLLIQYKNIFVVTTLALILLNQKHVLKYNLGGKNRVLTRILGPKSNI